MNLGERVRHWIRLAVHLGANPATLLGAALTSGAGITLVWFWLLQLTGPRPVHPYLGILLFLILPGVFLLGLLLIPAGLRHQRKRLQREGKLPDVYPKVDLQAPTVRNAFLALGGATALNVAVLGTATYKGVEYMDTNQFCGLTCHTVMTPEYSAFVDSPHSRVGCVQCHIGPGAGWFVRSKLSGTRQVFAVALGTYSRPIPSPVHELRPARETCEQCHWPQKFVGDKFLIKRRYAEDEENTTLYTVLALKVGGRLGQRAAGIHGAHLDEVERITYVSTDGRRQIIPKVVYRDDQGQLVEYVSEDLKVTPEEMAKGETRTMDCIDCHNRPTHAFELPERAVDRALTDGRLSRDLPFIRKKGVDLLKADYPDRRAAESRIPQALADYYRESYPEVYRSHRALVEAAGSALVAIYGRNVFPEMRVTWGTHPNHIGHEDFLGCFRCHDESHKARDGRTITQDCDACHSILAQEEKDPAILKQISVQG
jgi:hypothetical protein